MKTRERGGVAGIDVYGEVRMFHKNEFGDFYDKMEKLLPKSEVTKTDADYIMEGIMKKIEDNLYEMEKILCEEKYC